MRPKNEIDLLATHVSSAKDVPLRERLSAMEKQEEKLRDIMCGDARTIMHEEHAVHRPADTLEEYVSLKTVSELKELLADAGVTDIPKGPKPRLCELLMQELTDEEPSHHLERVALLGEDFVSDLRTLLAEGGHRVYGKGTIRRMEDLITPCFPVVAYYETGPSFVAFVPRELREMFGLLKERDWAPCVHRARVYDALRSYVRAVVDLRGITPLAATVDEFLAANPTTVEASELESELSEGDLLDDMPVRGLKNVENDVSYLIGTPLINHDHTIDEDLIDGIIADQERMPPRQPWEGLLTSGDVFDTVIETPEGKELLSLLDDHVPEGYSDTSFALDLIAELTWDLRHTDDLRCLCGRLAMQDLKAMGDFAARLFEAADRLNRVVPKWRLNGWTYAELAARAHDDPTFELLEPEPTELPDFTTDRASGLTWPTEKDEDGPWTTSAHKRDRFDEGFYTSERPVPESSPLAKEQAGGGASKEQGRSGTQGATPSPNADAPDEDAGDETDAGMDADEDVSVEDDESRVMRLREEAEHRLLEFEDWLKDSGLRPKTIDNHLRNVEPFLVYYLADYLGEGAEDGVAHVGGYLGDFFIRKMMWSTPASIKSTAASIKKFYKSMEAYGYIDWADLDFVLSDIKDGLAEWCETCAIYNDPDLDSPFEWW